MQWIYLNNCDRFKSCSNLRQTFTELKSAIGKAKRHKLVGSTPEILDNEFVGSFASHF
jgi:hypothetical protein